MDFAAFGIAITHAGLVAALIDCAMVAGDEEWARKHYGAYSATARGRCVVRVVGGLVGVMRDHYNATLAAEAERLEANTAAPTEGTADAEAAAS